MLPSCDRWISQVRNNVRINFMISGKTRTGTKFDSRAWSSIIYSVHNVLDPGSSESSNAWDKVIAIWTGFLCVGCFLEFRSDCKCFTVNYWIPTRKNDLRKRIPHEWPSSHGNYLKLGSVPDTAWKIGPCGSRKTVKVTFTARERTWKTLQIIIMGYKDSLS